MDATFGTDGITTTTIGESDAEIYGIALQSDSKVVAVGYGQIDAEVDSFIVARYTADGILDTTTFKADGTIPGVQETDVTGAGRESDA